MTAANKRPALKFNRKFNIRPAVIESPLANWMKFIFSNRGKLHQEIMQFDFSRAGFFRPAGIFSFHRLCHTLSRTGHEGRRAIYFLAFLFPIIFKLIFFFCSSVKCFPKLGFLLPIRDKLNFFLVSSEG